MGIILWPHLAKVCCVTHPPTRGIFPFYAKFGQHQLLDMQLSSVIVHFFKCLWHECHCQRYLHSLFPHEA